MLLLLASRVRPNVRLLQARHQKWNSASLRRRAAHPRVATCQELPRARTMSRHPRLTHPCARRAARPNGQFTGPTARNFIAPTVTSTCPFARRQSVAQTPGTASGEGNDSLQPAGVFYARAAGCAIAARKRNDRFGQCGSASVPAVTRSTSVTQVSLMRAYVSSAASPPAFTDADVDRCAPCRAMRTRLIIAASTGPYIWALPVVLHSTLQYSRGVRSVASAPAEGLPSPHAHTLVPCRLVPFPVAGLPRPFPPPTCSFSPSGVEYCPAQQLSGIVASSL